MKYRVGYHGKVYIIKAESAVEAIDRLENKPVFGSPMIPCKVYIKAISEDGGIEWAEAKADFENWNGGRNRNIIAQRE